MSTWKEKWYRLFISLPLDAFLICLLCSPLMEGMGWILEVSGNGLFGRFL
jgi:hypothetical protein